jgi:hypothetical protein
MRLNPEVVRAGSMSRFTDRAQAKSVILLSKEFAG